VGKLAGGKSVVARECTGHQVVRVSLCILLFVLYIVLISIVVVTVLLVCCSVKLPLSQPTSFLPFSFHFPPHPSGGTGNRATAWPFAAGHSQTKTATEKPREEDHGNHRARRDISDVEDRMRLPLGKATSQGDSRTSVLPRPDSGVSKVTRQKAQRSPPALPFHLRMTFFLEFLPNPLLIFSGFPLPKMDPL